MSRQPQPFDSYAYQYDEHFTKTGIGRAQRGQVMGWLLQYVSNPLKILEINCGTGEDAIQLATFGHEVVAKDASGKMIDVAVSKFSHIGGTLNVKFVRANFDELSSVFNSEKFQFIFSNFGGLNCADETGLKNLSADFASLLQPDGKMFLVVMGRKCKWEQLYFLAKGSGQKAFRRKSKEGATAIINGVPIRTYYYSPEEMKQIFSADFEAELIRPIGFFVPPSYLQSFFEKRNWLLKVLGVLDYFVQSVSFLANHADHYVIVFRKR